MTHIKIDCPACEGTGQFKTLATKCTYCDGKRKVKLTYHLKRIGHLAEAQNVDDFQKRSEHNTMK